MQWRQQPPAAQQPARSASSQPPAADDSGLLLEIAAANVDAAAQQQRMEGLQIYAHKLERTVSSARVAALHAWPGACCIPACEAGCQASMC